MRNIKNAIIYSLTFLLILSCSSGLEKVESGTKINFNLDVTNIEKDIFVVTLDVKGLKLENNVYNLPATVPGTYRILDFGRFVKTFKAYDMQGNEVTSNKLSTNRWSISDPINVTKIVYEIEDTYDSEIGSGIFPMGATGIEPDHAIINTFGVFGFFDGLQSHPIKVTMTLPESWTYGTALPEKDGVFMADNYDHLADSPILAGNLTVATNIVSGINVKVYVHSTQGMFNANQIKQFTDQVLNDAAQFISYPAAPNYVFLMSFLDEATLSRNKFQGFGALEHSYSSLYVLPENDFVKNEIANISAHEFFHIVTPLNIHSEVIETYNFTKPIPSRHLWLYEGTTEWASDIMQLRNKSIKVEDYLSRITEKINNDKRQYDPDYSLEKISLTSYEEAGEKQYSNIYERGAYVAALLDLKLLQLSNGKKGLREVIVDLSKTFGKNKAFKDAEFFDIFVQKTYPEIRTFIDNYIKGTESYPFEELFNIVGINYIESQARPALNLQLDLNENQQIFISELPPEYNGDLKTGDLLIELFGKEINLTNAREIIPMFFGIGIGNDYQVKVKRGEDVIETTHKVGETTIYGLFKVDENASDAQLKMREIWLSNLPIK